MKRRGQNLKIRIQEYEKKRIEFKDKNTRI